MSKSVVLVPIKSITADEQFQSRVQTDPETVKEFTELVLEDTRLLPPIDIFDINKKNFYVVDGFHRLAAYTKAGLQEIPCRIFKGTVADMVVHSTSANLKHGKPLTYADKRKAANMLFSQMELFSLSNKVLAIRVGVSAGTISRWRIDYCAEHGIDLPANNRAGINGASYEKPTELANYVPRIKMTLKDGTPSYSAKIKNKSVYLGTNKTLADAKLHQLIGARKTLMTQMVSLSDMQAFIQWAKRKGVYGIQSHKGANLPFGRTDIVGGTTIFRILTDFTQDSLVKAVGYLTILRPSTIKHRIIVCEHSEINRERRKAIEKVGITFLTPEEFIAKFSAKAKVSKSRTA